MPSYYADEPEHIVLLRDTLRRLIADKSPREQACQWERDHHLPVDVFAELADLGVLGLTFSQEYGGLEHWNRGWQKLVGPALESSMAKMFITDHGLDIVVKCQQVLGAYGCAEEYDMERHVRDMTCLPILGGSSNMQRNNIANRLRLGRS